MSSSSSWFSLMYDGMRSGSLDSRKSRIISAIQQEYRCSYGEACERFRQALRMMGG